MQKQQFGAIVNIDSMWAKAGWLALTQHLAMELADDHIRVNAVSPAVVKTPIYGAFIDADAIDWSPNPITHCIQKTTGEGRSRIGTCHQRG
ncbi:Oxidoreductase, short-chain dehydrogenase/reductase family [hydrothermal vent metagenome]|uniref:Oxidoreductase, short-chain dehydrogenase/reductase family n=1 Tax=hydrothermal vent metagenome TaxID=652676 RepID=A0A3B0W1A9_9ZZZZ